MTLDALWPILGAFGLGSVISGLLVNHVKETTARRTMRADLLDAQRDLANIEYDDLEGLNDASQALMRQAIIAGVPQWLLRHYAGIVALELGERRLESLGLLEAVEAEDEFSDVKRIPRDAVALLYSDAEQKFNFGIWHPFQVRLRAPWWRFKWNRFYRKIGHSKLRREMRRSSTI